MWPDLPVFSLVSKPASTNHSLQVLEITTFFRQEECEAAESQTSNIALQNKCSNNISLESNETWDCLCKWSCIADIDCHVCLFYLFVLLEWVNQPTITHNEGLEMKLLFYKINFAGFPYFSKRRKSSLLNSTFESLFWIKKNTHKQKVKKCVRMLNKLRLTGSTNKLQIYTGSQFNCLKGKPWSVLFCIIQC